MIARTWHGVVRSENAETYTEYLNKTGVPDYRNTPGNKGVYVLCSREGDQTHYLLLTLWDSIAAIKRFAGEDYEKARYYPEDEKFLLELEPHVTHYDVEVQP
jgi:heme-degrading monooxygenase HmoA